MLGILLIAQNFCQQIIVTSQFLYNSSSILSLPRLGYFCFLSTGGLVGSQQFKPQYLLNYNSNWLFAVYRSSHRRCSTIKVFLKITQNSQENFCARVPFLIKLQTCSFIKKETQTHAFFCEFCEIFKSTFFAEHFWMTVSVYKVIVQTLTFRKKAQWFPFTFPLLWNHVIISIAGLCWIMYIGITNWWNSFKYCSISQNCL